MEYNRKDKDSIYSHAKKLINNSFREVISNSHKRHRRFSLKEESASYGNVSRKGGVGELIEKHHFLYEPDNLSQADFPEAKVELKVTTFKTNKNKTISAKERLVISMIDYFKIVETDFYESNAWEKIENILLIYYEWKQEIDDVLDYIIKYVYMYSPSDDDLRIIINDYLKIQRIVREGRAHELSEGATLYLGAVTKASDSRVTVRQPNSDKPAKPRAFSLKTSFMTHLLRTRIVPHSETYDKIIKEDKVDDFERYVIEKINKYNGFRDKDLFEMFLKDKNTKAKNRYRSLTNEILGVKTKNAEEFIKANIELKTIRVEENGKVIESMSFPAFKAKELVRQTWEESDLYNFFSETKFLFVIYQRKGKDYYLDRAMFWNMPTFDLDNIVRKEWEYTVQIIKEGVKFSINDKNGNVSTNLPKLSNSEITHVRNHSSKSAYVINGVKYGKGKIGVDTDELPDGNLMSKQCFWLNNKYIKKIIAK